jgi:hypothetical protein
VIVHLVRYCITSMEHDISDRATVSAVEWVELHIFDKYVVPQGYIHLLFDEME